MKTIIARCSPDTAVVRGYTDEEDVKAVCAWMRVELPGLALNELEEIIEHFHTAPNEVISLKARLSMVVTVFDDAGEMPTQDVTVLAGVSCSLAAERVAPTNGPPWVTIESQQLTFGITGSDPLVAGAPEFEILSVEVPYAALGIALEVQDAVLETR